jgi:glycosyltransferase 2 family protein
LARRFGLQSGLLGLLVGLGCLAIILRQVDLRQSWNALAQLDAKVLLLPLLAFLVNIPLRAWRWQLIFPPAARPRFGSCLVVLGIGNMANFLLPARAGDLARCVLAGRSASLTESTRTLATLAVEKVLDGMALVGMLLLTLSALHPPIWVIELLRIATVIFVGAMVLLIALRYRARTFQNWLRWAFRQAHLSSLEQRFDGLLTSFVDGLSAVSSGGGIVILFLFTVAIWATEAALTWGLARSLGLGVTWSSAAIACAVLGLGMMIPAAPGGLGTYELLGTEVFKLIGISASGALTLTVVIHAWVFLTNVALGIILLTVKGLSLAQLRERLDGKSVDDAEANPAVRTLP